MIPIQDPANHHLVGLHVLTKRPFSVKGAAGLMRYCYYKEGAVGERKGTIRGYGKYSQPDQHQRGEHGN